MRSQLVWLGVILVVAVLLGRYALAPQADSRPARTPAPAVSAAPVPTPEEQALPGYRNVQALGRNPVPPSARSLARGRRIYAEYCATCHGDDLHGGGPLCAAITIGPPTADLRWRRNYNYGSGVLSVFRTAKYGIPNTGMAPLALNDPDLWDVVNYVRSQQH